MSKFDQTSTSKENGLYRKKFAEQKPYMAELNALRGLSGKGITPEILKHDNNTRTIHMADAGITLRSLRVDQESRFSMTQLRSFASQLFRCLSEVHAENFCHYDVKEDNICVQGSIRNDGSLDLDQDFKVKLIDFGLSFKIDDIPHHYVGNKSLGTPVCRSPEHINGLPHYGQAADVFCAAATIVQLIEDSPDPFPLAFGRPDNQIRLAQERVELTRRLTSASGEIVPTDIQRLLFGMLHPVPTERPSSKTCYHLLGLAC